MNWFQNLINKCLSCIPRLWLVNPDESGIRITLGKHVKSCGPGYYFYWGLIQECTKVYTMPQVVDLRPQSLRVPTDEDNYHLEKDIVVSGAIMYRITDARKALLNVQDFDRSLTTLALGVISRGELDPEKILKGIREEASGWGIKVIKTFITDRGDVTNVRLLTNTPSVSIISGVSNG